MKKELHPLPFNVYAFLAALIQNLDTQIQFEHKAADSDQVIKENRPAVMFEKTEQGGLSCVIPIELVDFFSKNPYRVEVKTAVVSDIKMPVAVMVFTPQPKTPTLVSPNGVAIASESETLKKIIEKS